LPEEKIPSIKCFLCNSPVPLYFNATKKICGKCLICNHPYNFWSNKEMELVKDIIYEEEGKNVPQETLTYYLDKLNPKDVTIEDINKVKQKHFEGKILPQYEKTYS